MWNLGAEYFEQALFIRGRSASLMADSLAQNIPFALARGAIIGAEFFGPPTICKVS
jgi:hypothetical protein